MIWRECFSPWRWALDADYSTLNKVNVDVSITIFTVASSLICAWIQRRETRLYSVKRVIPGVVNSRTDLKLFCRMLNLNVPASKTIRNNQMIEAKLQQVTCISFEVLHFLSGVHTQAPNNHRVTQWAGWWPPFCFVCMSVYQKDDLISHPSVSSLISARIKSQFTKSCRYKNAAYLSAPHPLTDTWPLETRKINMVTCSAGLYSLLFHCYWMYWFCRKHWSAKKREKSK